MEEHKVGRNLDALIAEKVMGLEVSRTCERTDRPELSQGPAKYWIGGLIELPYYSTNILAAWEVVQEMYIRKYVLRLESPYINVIPGSWKAMFGLKWVNPEAWDENVNTIGEETAALAICKAALKAVGNE